MGEGERFAPQVRNLVVNGRRTSVRLEPALWEAVDQICNQENWATKDLFSAVDRKRGDNGLTPAIRLFVVAYFRVAAERDTRSWRGFAEAGDGATSPLLRAALDSLCA